MGSLRAQVEGLQAQLRAAQEAAAAAKSEVGTRAADIPSSKSIRQHNAGMQLALPAADTPSSSRFCKTLQACS